ncbi:hypothetical protein HAX54_019055 [Datura stramonium]|uniref:DUF4378 domain-containing protein n=1 Tax=Datura stramonium TaxID=4076 RepID=A0ABS8S3U0_DATST|nr:hypothetical protein [Datura stramonium]
MLAKILSFERGHFRSFLEQKLKELTSEEELQKGVLHLEKHSDPSGANCFGLQRDQFHLDSLPVRSSRKEDLCDDVPFDLKKSYVISSREDGSRPIDGSEDLSLELGSVNMPQDEESANPETSDLDLIYPGGKGKRAICLTPLNYYILSKIAAPDSATSLVGNSLDIDHRSPGCVLEATFSTDSYLSSSPNSSSKDKVLAESVDSIYDEPLFPEPDRDLSDCASSLFARRSCRVLMTEHVNNISGVLSKIDQLKGSKLSYAKEVVLNTELIFGTPPEQQALPVDDGFSVSHFLLNELEMLSSLLWMTFGQLLGCNDPKQMNQLKGFAFDCLLEYLDSKFGRYSDSGFRTWIKLPSSMTKEILIADIIEEVRVWTEFVALIPDELIEWDMSHSLGKWTDFEIEEFECGIEVDRHILQVLVDEVVLDLYSSS